MKVLVVLLGLLAGNSAFACVDISGKYLMGERFIIQYEQVACDSLAEKWCGPDGDCETGSSHTWLLDGVMRQEGSNPSKWASIKSENQSLHRTNLWDSGTVLDGRQCWWTDLWYAKDEKQNLKVTYKLDCLNGKGGYKEELLTEIWSVLK